MSSDNNHPILTIIGAGGIGSQTIDLLIPALKRISQRCEIIMMDGDIVESQKASVRVVPEAINLLI